MILTLWIIWYEFVKWLKKLWCKFFGHNKTWIQDTDSEFDPKLYRLKIVCKRCNKKLNR